MGPSGPNRDDVFTGRNSALTRLNAGAELTGSRDRLSCWILLDSSRLSVVENITPLEVVTTEELSYAALMLDFHFWERRFILNFTF